MAPLTSITHEAARIESADAPVTAPMTTGTAAAATTMADPRIPESLQGALRRKRYDLALLGMVTLLVAVLYAETFLRINGLLPELPIVPLNLGEVLFGAANGAALLGTLYLAFKAPPAATDEAPADIDEVIEPRVEQTPSHGATGQRRLRPVLTDA